MKYKVTQKGILRSKFKKLRNKLSAKNRQKASREIFKKIQIVLQNKDFKNIAVYLPINNEVKTNKIIDTLLKKGANIFIAAYFKKINKYRFVKFNGWENLEEGPYKILQSSNFLHSSEVKLDLVIIPGLAFSKKGVRLGYGKGVFDKLLAPSKAFKIGLAYDFQIIDKIPQEKHDLVMDIIVTEKSIYSISTIGV